MKIILRIKKKISQSFDEVDDVLDASLCLSSLLLEPGYLLSHGVHRGEHVRVAHHRTGPLACR